jgi:hypothetical protein
MRAKERASAGRNSVGAAAALMLGGVAACGGANPSTGLGAYFRATGAQFIEGGLTADMDAAGPKVHTIASNNNRLYPGVQNKAMGGTVENHASAVAIGLVGDIGTWIVPVGSEDQVSPPDLTFSTRGSFSPAMPPGTYDLLYRGVDLDGVMGPSSTQTLTLEATPAQGAFVISLEWDGPADLDLHVVAPATGGPGMVEVWTKKRNSLAPRSFAEGPFTPQEIAAAGVLDFDSNSGCIYDGRNLESVLWTEAPPPGHYIVRVDASSMCGASAARWRAIAVFNGTQVREVFGQMGDADTTTPHVAGAGLTVLEFDVMP